jgi:uncharacterized protein (TIGR02118 family)
VIKVTILYPNKPGSHFDVDYYLNVHMPMAIRVLGSTLKAVSVEIGVSGTMPADPPPFAAMVGFTCESVLAFNRAMMRGGEELRADIPKYTDIEPIIQIGEIRISQ